MVDRLNKSELIKAISAHCDAPPGVTEQVIDGFLDVVSLSLACGEDVLISGFGKFEVRKHGASTRRNPRSGEMVIVHPTTTCGFKPSALLKQRLNQNQSP